MGPLEKLGGEHKKKRRLLNIDYFSDNERELVNDLLNDSQRRTELLNPSKNYPGVIYSEDILQKAEEYLNGKDPSPEAKHAFLRLLLEAELQEYFKAREIEGLYSQSSEPQKFPAKSARKPDLDYYDRQKSA